MARTRKATPSEPIAFIPPMECLPVKKLPDGPEWVYELKLDGYRAQAIHEANGNRLRGSRKFTSHSAM